MSRVEAQAFLMPPVRYKAKDLLPIVVTTKQGQAFTRNDDALVGAGAGILQAGGPIPSAFSRTILDEGRGEPEAYNRTRLLFLVDRSDSMADPSGAGNSRLAYVQDKINALAESLKDIPGIEYVLLQYDDACQHLITTNDPKQLIEKIREIRVCGSTNIALPIRKARELMSRDSGESRNLVVLVTDGRHNVGDCSIVINEALALPGNDCGVYIVGVGPNYDEQLLRNILATVKYGGMTHIPLLNSTLNIFGGRDANGRETGILPIFIQQMRTAPVFPVVSFDKFDMAFNLTPMVREVIEEQYERKLAALIGTDPNQSHRPATIGYLNEGYAVGFIDPALLDKARIRLIIKSRGNEPPHRTEDISIVPFADVSLDPEERLLVESAPYDALNCKIRETGDAALIREYLKDNPNLDPRQVNQFSRIADSIERGDQQGEREEGTQLASGFTARSFTRGTRPGQFSDVPGSLSSIGQSGGDSLQSNPPSLEPANAFSNVVLGPLESASNSQLSTRQIKFSPTRAASINGIKIKINPKNLSPLGKIVLYDGQSVSIGRRPDSDVQILGDRRISESHCLISNKGGTLFITDQSSKNGTWVNNERVTKEKELSSGDFIGLAAQAFKIEFS